MKRNRKLIERIIREAERCERAGLPFDPARCGGTPDERNYQLHLMSDDGFAELEAVASSLDLSTPAVRLKRLTARGHRFLRRKRRRSKAARCVAQLAKVLRELAAAVLAAIASRYAERWIENRP